MLLMMHKERGLSVTTTKAIILAAGMGRRMRPFTDSTHKTLLTINGRAVIEWIIDPLLVNGVDDITIVTGYMSVELTTFLSKTYPALTLNYIHNERYACTNNIHSLALALDHIIIDSDILLLECDLVFEEAVIKRLLMSEHSNVAMVDHYRSGMDGTVVEIKEGIVSQVILPHLQDENFNFDDKYKMLNIYRFSHDFCAGAFKKLLTHYAKVIDDNCYYELVLGMLIYLQKEVIHAQPLVGEKWTEIDDPNDLDVARAMFEPDNKKQLLDQSFGGLWNYEVVDFCYIRNMHFPTTSILAELRRDLPKLIQNYGSNQEILNRKLAYFLLCNEDNVTLLNGVSQIYPILGQFLQNKQVLLPYPTFGEYHRTFPHATLYYDDVGFDLNGIITKASEHEVIIFVNPNNPTGSILPTDTLYQFAEAHPEKIIILDESFIDFSSQNSILPLLESNPLANVVLLKSLGKALGVPGIRFGYVYSSNIELNTFVNTHIPIWNINSVTEHFLKIILKHREALRHSFETTVLEREQFAKQLAALPIVKRVYPGEGNFLLISLTCSQDICQQLAKILLRRYQIYIKDVSMRFSGSSPYWRLAVRKLAENSRFVECLHYIATNRDV